MNSTILVGDSAAMLATLPEKSVHVAITSPPYFGLRDYVVPGQLGLERSPEQFLRALVESFGGVRRALRDDGTLWVNIGDTYHDKSLLGIPWLLAMALRQDGWLIRSDIIWAKPNPMPEPARDRPAMAHEYLFLLTKGPRYYYDALAVREPAKYGRKEWVGGIVSGKQNGDGHKSAYGGGRGDPSTGRNCRSVWTIPTQAFRGAHFATFPERLVEPCIRAGTSERGCCPGCGASWKRILKRTRTPTRPGLLTKITGTDAATHGNRDPGRHVTATETVGWEPGCKCGIGHTVPCTVLDNFAGAGTTGVVAAKLGRNFVGIELNPEYAALAERRIGLTLKPSTYRDMRSGEGPLYKESSHAAA